MKNVMFQKTPATVLERGAFDLTHENKFSGNIGEILPFLWLETLPGESFEIKPHVLTKFSPLLAPLLHRVDVFTHIFQVSNWQIFRPYANYGGWHAFITGDQEGRYTSSTVPYVTISNANKAYFAEGTYADFFDLPVIDAGTTVTQDVDINVMPLLAMHWIIDNYYRDENIQEPICDFSPSGLNDVPLYGGDLNTKIDHIFSGNINGVTFAKYYRAYEKDYFRGALPTAFAGASSDVELDLDIVDAAGLFRLETAAGANPAAGSVDVTATQLTQDQTPSNLRIQQTSGVLDYYTSTLEVQEMWRAEAIAKYLDVKMRGGHRYTEMIESMWGIKSRDTRSQIPEYIGGGRQAVVVNSIMNQSQVLDSTDTTVDPQGLETGKALSYGTNYANCYSDDYGFIIGLISVLPRVAYGAGQMDRFYRKFDMLDWFTPQLQGLGDQPVYQYEVGYDATGTDMDNIYGYQVPWAEYKFKNSKAHGAFLSTLDYWHMASIGDTSGAGPDLNYAWVHCMPTADEVSRIFADQTGEDTLYFEIVNEVRAIRPMRVHDIPR